MLPDCKRRVMGGVRRSRGRLYKGQNKLTTAARKISTVIHSGAGRSKNWSASRQICEQMTWVRNPIMEKYPATSPASKEPWAATERSDVGKGAVTKSNETAAEMTAAVMQIRRKCINPGNSLLLRCISGRANKPNSLIGQTPARASYLASAFFGSALASPGGSTLPMAWSEGLSPLR